MIAFFIRDTQVSVAGTLVTYSSSFHACSGNRTVEISHAETLIPGSYQLMGSVILFNNLATGEYIFNCIDENGGTETMSFEVIPFPFRFKNNTALITPKKISYAIGDVITCVSKRGLSASRWQFMWASRSNFMPTFSKIQHKLMIDANFAPEVIYIYQCDTDFVVFNVLREPHNLRIVQNSEQSIKCTAEGTDLVYFWRVRNSLGEQTFASTEGNILHLKKSRNMFHRVICVAVSATDEQAHKVVEFYNKVDKPKITISNHNKDFLRSNYIGCEIDKRKVAVRWDCSRHFDTRLYSKVGNHLYLEDEYFSINNVLYECVCSTVGLGAKYYSENLTFSVTSFKDSVCWKDQKRYFAIQKFCSTICLFVIIASALGPFRHLPKVVTSYRDRKRLASYNLQ